MANPTRSIYVSLSLKIGLLLTSTLAGSILFYVTYGAGILTSDKTSYIYESKLREVQTVGSAIESRIEQNAGLLDFLTQVNPAGPDSPQALQATLSRQAERLHVESFGLLRWTPEGTLLLDRAVNWSDAAARSLLSEQGWTRPVSDTEPVRVGFTKAGALAVGRPVRNAAGEIVLGVALTPANRVPDFLGDGLQLFDSRARLLVDEGTPTPLSDPRQLTALRTSPDTKPGHGAVKTLGLAGADYIVAYRPLRVGNLFLASSTPLSSALKAAQELEVRTLMTGLFILMISIGLCSLVTRRILQRLGFLWEATQYLSRGHFDVVLPSEGRVRDEVSDLSLAFNEMATRIRGLLHEATERARMEKELETAQALQSKFFPQRPLLSPHVEVHGKYVPASECAGDWWDYAQSGPRLFLIVGDVTGHGASSALLTAAAHSVFHHIFNEQGGGSSLDLASLLRQLNHSLHKIGQGETTMAFTALAVDLETGNAELVTGGNPAGVRVGRTAEATPAVGSLVGARHPSLGETAALEVKSSTLQLAPGEQLFLFTDGFFEPREGDGKKVSKRTFQQWIAGVSSLSSGDAVATKLVQEAQDFFGATGAAADDLTMVLVKVAPSAPFTAAADSHTPAA